MSSSSDSEMFSPTQTHPVIELTSRANKKLEGYVCPTCGHLAVEEDEIIGLTCPKCLQKWLVEHEVQQLVPVSDYKEERDSALVPTIKITDKVIDMNKHPYDETTKIMHMTEAEILKRKVRESDFNIPGL